MLAGIRAGDYSLVEVRLIFGYMHRYLFDLRSFVTLDLLAWLIRGFPRGFLTSAIFFAMAVILVVPRAHREGDEPDDLQLLTLTESRLGA